MHNTAFASCLCAPFPLTGLLPAVGAVCVMLGLLDVGKIEVGRAVGTVCVTSDCVVVEGVVLMDAVEGVVLTDAVEGAVLRELAVWPGNVRLGRGEPAWSQVCVNPSIFCCGTE